jgi:hypothetical protein
MSNEIKRNTWVRFCKKFSSVNQYRHNELCITDKNRGSSSLALKPFMGVAIAKKGRLIDGIQFYAGHGNVDKVIEPVLTIRQPASITLEKDKNGRDNRLCIKSKDGIEARLNLHGDKETEQARSLIAQIAYSMYERRGYSSGDDKDDWFVAEQKVKDAELHLTE